MGYKYVDWIQLAEVAGSCEHINGPYGALKFGERFGHLDICRFLKDCSTPLNKLVIPLILMIYIPLVFNICIPLKRLSLYPVPNLHKFICIYIN
jgi:hypothetical protein